MWLSAIKLALNAGTHIYKKKQETKMAMADAQHMAATKMARGETEYQGKLLEARQSDWKDEAVLIILTLPILVIAYGVFSDDPNASVKIKEFFEKKLDLTANPFHLFICDPLLISQLHFLKTSIFP